MEEIAYIDVIDVRLKPREKKNMLLELLEYGGDIVHGVQNCIFKPPTYGMSESWIEAHYPCTGNRFSIFNNPIATGGNLDVVNLPQGLAVVLGVYLFLQYNGPQKVRNMYHFLCPKPNGTPTDDEPRPSEGLTNS